MKASLILFFVLVILLISHRAFSQEDKLILKFSPLSLMDPSGENIHFGLEFLSEYPYSIETDFAVFIGNPDKEDETPRIKDRTGFKIKPEVRYYFKNKNKAGVNYNGVYIANELFFLKDKFKRGDTFTHYDQVSGTNNNYFDFEKIRRIEIGNNFKIGYQWVIDRLVSFDFYVGGGLKYRNGSYDYDIADPNCCGPPLKLFEPSIYKGLGSNITFGLRVGVVILKKNKRPITRTV